jgi:ATP-dependent DNA helicase RecG
MVHATVSCGLPEPEFMQIHDGFEVIFRKLEALLDDLNERQKQAWTYLREHEIITKAIYADLCRCPPRTALKDLQDLVKKGILKREGVGKATSYRRVR